MKRMQKTGSLPRRVRRISIALAAATAVAALAAGCGSGTSPSGSQQAATSGNSGVAHARALVAALEQPTTRFPAPGPAIDARSLRGKSVWYIPISSSVPVFAIAEESLQSALGKDGIDLHTCSGNADPSATATCIEHAIAAGAAGIIADAIPVALAPNAFQSAQAHHIPVLIVDQLPPAKGQPGAVNSKYGGDALAYTLEQNMQLVSDEADFTIAESGGKASVLALPFTDSPSTLAWDRAGVQTLRHGCPACTVAIQKIGLANFSLVPSQTSSALLSHPGVEYVLPEFDVALQGVDQGIQQAGYASKVKVVTSAGDLAALQQIRAGRLAADVGDDFPYAGWADADEMMRMMLGRPIVEEHMPIRLFDAKDVKGLALTTAAQASGQWYGSSAYTAMFERLWGLK